MGWHQHPFSHLRGRSVLANDITPTSHCQSAKCPTTSQLAVLGSRNVDTDQGAPLLDVTLGQVLCFRDGAYAVADEHRVNIPQASCNRRVQENKLTQAVPAVFVWASLSWIRNERFSDVITILSSRASQPTAQSKTGVLPFTSFLSFARDNSPRSLRACQIIPAAEAISSCMTTLLTDRRTSVSSARFQRPLMAVRHEPPWRGREPSCASRLP